MIDKLLHPNGFFFGILMGIATTFFAYFVLQGLNSALQNTLMEGMQGFSYRFICILSVCANILPLAILNRQYRHNAAKGLMTFTVVMVFVVLFYFRSQLLS